MREIREATRAFNTMQDRLLRYLDSRTGVLAAMSHDLRTPLTRLRLRVESVADAQLASVSSRTSMRWKAWCAARSGCSRDWSDDEAFERWT